MPTLPEDIEVVSSEREITGEDIESYWTDDAMAQAIPIEPDIDETQLLALLTAEVWQQEGTQTVMESQPADNSSVGDHEDFADISNTFATTRVPQSHRDDMPYSTVGKMFMSFGGTDYVGTGWVVAEKAVFTAGHCVFSRQHNQWAENVLFVPQYDDGSAPLGRWTSGTIWSLRGWTSKHDFKYDLATFATDRLIRPSTGSLGWMANFPPNQGPYESLGYPAVPIPGYNFNGKHMWQSIGGYINGMNPIQMHNNMTQGCSGGPWVVARNRNVYANGLNSFRYIPQPGTMYSPYFGDGFLNLYNTVKGLT